MSSKSILPLLLVLLVFAGFGCERLAAEAAQAAVPPEAAEAADVLNKAPMVLILSTGQHYLDTRRWPENLADIRRVLGVNAHVLPSSFAYESVKFTTQNRKQCTIQFSFEWPTLEGGRADGRIEIRAAGSLKDIARGAKVTWATPPRLRADLLPKEKTPEDAKSSGDRP